ncbi:ornithine cyclodeaminase family protein [Synergistaceae bacterium OttesenSCG-928-D05]|nr:ornithine cyclodeaminase family protein [Synergistaceae bacterium OttesenSCG-928-D05]
MLIISAEEIRNIFSMKDAIASDREAFILQTEGGCEAPPRINFDVGPNAITSFMPALVKRYPQAGIKIVSTYTENPNKGLPAVSATVILADPETGIVNALIDGTELTRLRTAAVSGLATSLLARTDASTGALFGTGGQAASQLEALMTVRNFSEIRVFDKNPEFIDSFIQRTAGVAEKFGTKIIKAKTSDDAIDNADVITTVTTSAEPVFDGEKIKPGAHINAVGVFLPHKRELDEATLRRADKIFIDNWEAIESEAGDFLIPISEGKFSFDKINGELGELILGKKEGRSGEREITLMKTVGFATLDVVIAHNVYQKAIEAGVGRNI